jgi:hypothetical protein
LPVSNSIVIPELVIFQTIKASLDVLREDYALNSADASKSFLMRCIGAYNSLQNYDTQEQAKAVFIRAKNANEPRYVDVSMGFDSDRIGKKNPHIHILLQNDSPKDDSLGIGEGNVDPYFDDEESTYLKSKVRRFTQQVNLLISGDNSNEKYLVYHVLKTVLIQFIPYMNALGLENVSFRGGDVSINTQVAGNVYMRSLTLNFDYDLVSPNIDQDDFINKIYLAIDAIYNEQETEIYSNYPPEPEPESGD